MSISPSIRNYLVIIVLLTLVSAIYIRYISYSIYFQNTDDASIQSDQVTISSKFSGYVKGVYVEDNQFVDNKTLLVEVDPTELQNDLMVADNEISSSLATENAKKIAEGEAEIRITEALSKLKAAGAGLTFAQGELVRYGPLASTGAEPASLMSQLEASRDRASAEFASARANVEQARRYVASIRAYAMVDAIKSGTAQVRRKAVVNDLEATRIYAPIAGRVASKGVRTGQFVHAGSRLMTVVPDQIYVVANFKETQVSMIRSGQPVAIRVDALPGVMFTGEVISLTPGTGGSFALLPPQNSTGNFTKIIQRVQVKIKIDAGPKARRILVPGLSLEVEVDTRGAQEVIEEIKTEQNQSGK